MSNWGHHRDAIQRLAASTVGALLIGGLAAMPARAAASSSVTIPSSDLGVIFPALPVKDLGLSDSELGGLLSSVGGLSVLGAQLQSVTSTLLQEDPDTTVEGLVSGVLGDGLLAGTLKLLKLGLTPAEVFQALSPNQRSTLLANVAEELQPEQLAALLGGLAGQLSEEELSALQTILTGLAGTLPVGQRSTLEGDMRSLLGSMSKTELTALLAPLQGALGATSATELQGLLGELGSHTPSQLKSQLQAFLGGLQPEDLAALLTQSQEKASPTQLSAPLHDLLGDLQLSPGTGESLAGELNASLQGLEEDLATTVSSTTPLLRAAVGDEGQVLGLLSAPGALKMSLLSAVVSVVEGPLGGGSETEGENSGSTGSETEPETSEKTGSGGSETEIEDIDQGGSGGGSPSKVHPGEEVSTGVDHSLGTGSTQQTETINVFPSVIQGATTASTTKRSAGVRILAHTVRGKRARILLELPAPGTLTLVGSHLGKLTRKVSRAQRMTVEVTLTRAGLASLHRHKNLLRVTLKAVFRSHAGAGSSAGASLRFR